MFSRYRNKAEEFPYRHKEEECDRKHLTTKIVEEFSISKEKDVFSVYQWDADLSCGSGFYPWEIEEHLWRKIKEFETKKEADRFAKKASGKVLV